MKDIKRYCDRCKKETESFMKVMILKTDYKVIASRSYDYCEDCVTEIFPEFKNKNRAGLQK